MLIPDMIQTILPGNWVLITIIDLWSYMLNCDEVYKDPESPLRFFSTTICLVSYNNIDTYIYICLFKDLINHCLL